MSKRNINTTSSYTIKKSKEAWVVSFRPRVMELFKQCHPYSVSVYITYLKNCLGQYHRNILINGEQINTLNEVLKKVPVDMSYNTPKHFLSTVISLFFTSKGSGLTFYNKGLTVEEVKYFLDALDVIYNMDK